MKELNNNKTPLVKTLKSNSLYLLIMNNASAIMAGLTEGRTWPPESECMAESTEQGTDALTTAALGTSNSASWTCK